MRIAATVIILLLTTALPSRGDDIAALTGKAMALIPDQQYEEAFEVLSDHAIAGNAEAQFQLGRVYERAARNIGDFGLTDKAQLYISSALVWYLTAGENGHQAARQRLLYFVVFGEPEQEITPYQAVNNYNSGVCSDSRVGWLHRQDENYNPVSSALRRVMKLWSYKVNCALGRSWYMCIGALAMRLKVEDTAQSNVERLAYAWVSGPITGWLQTMAKPDIHLYPDRNCTELCPNLVFEHLS